MAKSDTEAPKKRTRAKKSTTDKPRPNKEIDLAVRCTMCHNGRFEKALGDYEFKYRNEPMKVTGIPCLECDNCGGRKYDSDDIMRPVNYMKASGHNEVEFDEVMSFYWDWYRAQKAQK
jgi:YgiT-type zinc finger domain-containing protein